MKHFLVSIKLMCLTLLLLIMGNTTYAQQAKQTSAKMLHSAAPSTIQTEKATKKLSLKEIKALKAKQLEEKNAKRNLRTTARQLVKTKTSNGKFEGKKKALIHKVGTSNLESLSEKVAEINANLEAQDSDYRAVITDFKGSKVVKMQSIRPGAIYYLGN